MSRKITLLLFLALISLNILAQSISSIDFENLKSDELSDAQITQIYRQAQEQGLSIDELSSLAIARGMSPTEVAKLRSRFNSIPDNKN